jgi:hypothetical protein
MILSFLIASPELWSRTNHKVGRPFVAASQPVHSSTVNNTREWPTIQATPAMLDIGRPATAAIDTRRV